MRKPARPNATNIPGSDATASDEASDILMELLGNDLPPPGTSTAKRNGSGSMASPPAPAMPRIPPPNLRNRILPDVLATPSERAFRSSVEAVVVARNGGVMVIGWIDDLDCPLQALTLACGSWRVTFDAAFLARMRRTDVEGALQVSGVHRYGFFGLVASAALPDVSATALIDIHMADGGVLHLDAPTRTSSPSELRDLALGYLTSAEFFGNAQIEGAACLDGGLGNELVSLNRAITTKVVGGRHVERFGTRRKQPLGSIIVCLYGKAEFLFVQSALFAGLPGIEDYEFVYVSNSPEISETMLREAKLCQQIYGLNQTVVLLPGNAGFGAANNAGVTAALGRRILNVNPDVFPRQKDWAAQHTSLVDTLPSDRTKLFGVPLYYDDGSLMHGGMYFEMDGDVSLQSDSIGRRRMARVEHYGKGAPSWSTGHLKPRPVPALTGAFMSFDRAWYEQLGGFTEDYIFGHYEDADLCLKSLAGGHPAWIHDLRLWHLEGKGSTRRPHHEGGSLVNRWYFTRRWEKTILSGLTGPNPTHPAMQVPAVDAPQSPPEPSSRQPLRRPLRPVALPVTTP